MPPMSASPSLSDNLSLITLKIAYDISELLAYINWPYFFFAWQVKDGLERTRLQEEAETVLQQIDGQYHAYGLFELFDAYSEGDDIVVFRGAGSDEGGVRIPQSQKQTFRIPCLRQQQGNPPYLCLSDFLQPLNICHSSRHTPHSSKIGLFATSVDHGLETDFNADLLVEKFQGIRPAVGYPSLPDTSLNFVIDNLLDMKQIGIRLTESGAMKPHASVSGMMFDHPQARYFSIGKIGEDQLTDYARRRGLPVEVCRKFLAANL